MQSRRQALWRFMSLCLEKVFVQAQRTFLLTSCSYQHIMIFGGESRRPIKHKIQRCCAAACRNDSDGGSGGGFKGTGCRAPRERHCKRKNVPRRCKPLGRKSVIAGKTCEKAGRGRRSCKAPQRKSEDLYYRTFHGRAAYVQRRAISCCTLPGVL